MAKNMVKILVLSYPQLQIVAELGPFPEGKAYAAACKQFPDIKKYATQCVAA
jgi:hypothetical protein